MPSSEDSAVHNPSRVSIDNGRLQETHKFSTVKNEITAKNMYAHLYIYNDFSLESTRVALSYFFY